MSPLASRGGAPHLWVEMLHEMLPRDAPKPGHRKALLRHGGLRLVFTGLANWTCSSTSNPPGNTTLGEKGREGDGRGKAAGLKFARGGKPVAAAWTYCVTAAMGRFTRGGSSRRPLRHFPDTAELVSLRPPFGTAQACRGERSRTWRWPPVSCLCLAGRPDSGLSVPPR